LSFGRFVHSHRRPFFDLADRHIGELCLNWVSLAGRIR
jgi:hypothetical protein